MHGFRIHYWACSNFYRRSWQQSSLIYKLIDLTGPPINRDLKIWFTNPTHHLPLWSMPSVWSPPRPDRAEKWPSPGPPSSSSRSPPPWPYKRKAPTSTCPRRRSTGGCWSSGCLISAGSAAASAAAPEDAAAGAEAAAAAAAEAEADLQSP